MQATRKEKKMDILFVSIVILLILIGIAGSFLVHTSHRSQEESKPLPSGNDYHVNGLIITEVVTNNGGVFVNENGKICDYIEIYNGKDKAIDLKGYGLSDDPNTIKWVFSDVMIEPHQYLVVSLTGDLEAGLNAPFKLSSKGGERIILANPNFKVVDALDTVRLNKNQAYMRSADGGWFISDLCTPGYANSEEGHKAYTASLYSLGEGELEISEALPKNKANLLVAGSFPSYIEVHNTSSHAVDLSAYTLSDSSSIPFRKQLPAVNLEADGYYVIYGGSSNGSSEDRLGFDIDSGNGEILLGRSGKIVDEVKYSSLENGIALVRKGSSFYKDPIISQGYANSAAGIEAFQKDSYKNADGLLINEVMSNNDSYLLQNGAEAYDWIEFFNNSSSVISLRDYQISTNEKKGDLFPMPDVALEPGAYYILICSGNTALSNLTYVHAGFRIGQGESLYLWKNEELTDYVYIPALKCDTSYGRDSESGWFYIEVPTPAEANSSGIRASASPVSISQEGGVFENVSSLRVELEGAGDIRYSLDGSEPDESSPLYTTPIVLTSTSVLKARSFEEGMIGGAVSTASYIINEHHDLPVVSVSIDPADFYYLNANLASAYEYPAYAEYYDGEDSFVIPCSISLFGGNARWQDKKAYTLRFSDRWGQSCLEYPVFENRDNSVYQALVLRGGSTDFEEAFIRDILGTSLVDDYTDVDVQAYKSAVVYFNGEYWGVYNIREKVNKHFVAEHFQVPAESANVLRIDGNVSAGDYTSLAELREYCRTHDLSEKENYDYVAQHINIDNLIDYWIAEGFVTNNDLLNVRYISSPYYDEGRFHMVFYDLDFAWYNPTTNWYTQYLANPAGMGIGTTFENDIIRALLKSPEFRERWLERMSVQMKTTWKEENVLNRIDELETKLEKEMIRDHERWGISIDHWRECVDDLREYTKERIPVYLSTTQSYFGLSDQRMKELFEGLW